MESIRMTRQHPLLKTRFLAVMEDVAGPSDNQC